MAKDKDIREMAEELGIKKENVEKGLKEQPEQQKKMITAAYKFMKGAKK